MKTTQAPLPPNGSRNPYEVEYFAFGRWCLDRRLMSHRSAKARALLRNSLGEQARVSVPLSDGRKLVLP